MPTRSQRLHELDNAVPADERWSPVTCIAKRRDHHLLLLAFARLFVRHAQGGVHLMHLTVAQEARKGWRVVLPKLDLEPVLRLLVALVGEVPHAAEHVVRYVEDHEFSHQMLRSTAQRSRDVLSYKRSSAREGLAPSIQMSIP